MVNPSEYSEIPGVYSARPRPLAVVRRVLRTYRWGLVVASAAIVILIFAGVVALLVGSGPAVPSAAPPPARPPQGARARAPASRMEASMSALLNLTWPRRDCTWYHSRWDAVKFKQGVPDLPTNENLKQHNARKKRQSPSDAQSFKTHNPGGGFLFDNAALHGHGVDSDTSVTSGNEEPLLGDHWLVTDGSTFPENDTFNWNRKVGNVTSISAADLRDALAAGSAEVSRREELAKDLAARNLILRENSAPYRHQKIFRSTAPKAGHLARRGLTLTHATAYLRHRLNLSAEAVTMEGRWMADLRRTSHCDPAEMSSQDPRDFTVEYFTHRASGDELGSEGGAGLEGEGERRMFDVDSRKHGKFEDKQLRDRAIQSDLQQNEREKHMISRGEPTMPIEKKLQDQRSQPKFQQNERAKFEEKPLRFQPLSTRAKEETCVSSYRVHKDCVGQARYRSADGSCNNLEHPRWGASFTPFRRSMPPHYSDGVSVPRLSVKGGPLPSAHVVSKLVHPSKHVSSPTYTHLAMMWGQLVDHDITATAQTTGEGGATITCCSSPVRTDPRLRHPECLPVTASEANSTPHDPSQSHNTSLPMPHNDSQPIHHDASEPHNDFSLHEPSTSHNAVQSDNVSSSQEPSSPHNISQETYCMEFVRSSPASSCHLGPREQLNQQTAFLDGSVIYGATEAQMVELRLYKSGLLKTQVTADGRQLPPPDMASSCTASSQAHYGRYCFKSGDARVNEHVLLAGLHVVLTREHNRVALQLEDLNPHWGDERIFQEARRIVGAELQHITYTEYLPLLLGPQLVRALRLRPDDPSDYSTLVHPGIANSFAAAAYRFGHSMVQGLLQTISADGLDISFSQLSRHFFAPYLLYDVGGLASLLRGSLAQRAAAVDSFFTAQVTEHLFQSNSSAMGLDLVALNIQRGRDHGLAPYVRWRMWCGLPRVNSFSDLTHDMDPGTLRRVAAVYGDVGDVDLYTGGLAELPVPGGLVGPTFACLLGDQFLRLKAGDRFWYEGDQLPQAFSQDQLREVRKSSLAGLLCQNVEGLGSVQRWPLKVFGEDNPTFPCFSSSLPTMDLGPWEEGDI